MVKRENYKTLFQWLSFRYFVLRMWVCDSLKEDNSCRSLCCFVSPESKISDISTVFREQSVSKPKSLNWWEWVLVGQDCCFWPAALSPSMPRETSMTSTRTNKPSARRGLLNSSLKLWFKVNMARKEEKCRFKETILHFRSGKSWAEMFWACFPVSSSGQGEWQGVFSWSWTHCWPGSRLAHLPRCRRVRCWHCSGFPTGEYSTPSLSYFSRNQSRNSTESAILSHLPGVKTLSRLRQFCWRQSKASGKIPFVT